jgi:hypothetical protein
VGAAKRLEEKEVEVSPVAERPHGSFRAAVGLHALAFSFNAHGAVR